MRAAHLCERILGANLPEGMTTAQYSVLRTISRLDGDVTITRLAGLMTVSQPTMSSTVRRLEEKGLVEVSIMQMDGRAKHIALTRAGDVLRKAADQSLSPVLDTLSGALDTQGWQKLQPALAQLNAILDEAISLD